jgi:hypothetical protein
VLKTIFQIAVCGVFAPMLVAQDSESGVSLPVTISAGAMYTQRLQLVNPAASPYSAGLNVMLYPTIRLGSHWFGYAAIEERVSPYLYYDAYDPNHESYTNVIQAYAGYQVRTENTSIVIKAGRLVPAFGAFPLRYDDAANPLLDQPLSYIQTLTVSSSQLPCGAQDLAAQHYGFVFNSCGGQGPGRGLTPVTLYGLPGAQVEISGHPFDARLQIANSSASNPQPWSRTGEYAQWEAGAGYTILQGFRVGFSAFRGPYLNASLVSALPLGSTLRSFPASAVGIDAQWARGRWSAVGEWQRFQYDLPNFTLAPSVVSTYGELKAIVTPRFFVAGRAGWMNPGGARDHTGSSIGQFAPGMASYELAAGAWINRHQLLKASYEWLKIENVPSAPFNVLGVQFVTTFHALDRAFHQ